MNEKAKLDIIVDRAQRAQEHAKYETNPKMRKYWEGVAEGLIEAWEFTHAETINIRSDS